MQNHLTYLVVEDDTIWSQALSEGVRTYFETKRKMCAARIVGSSAYDGRQANEQIGKGGWDLVTLDMNLGAGAGKTRISGLDLLGDIAHGNKAFFVIIVTGAVTDPTLEKIYGKETADLLRYGAMNEAVKLMPAARVRILHKPDGKNVEEATAALRPQLHSALDQFCSVSLDRNIFRPMPGTDKLYEVCYNGGARLTIPQNASFEIIRSILAQPNNALNTVHLIADLAQSSGKIGATLAKEPEVRPTGIKASNFEYQGHQNDETTATEGLAWEEIEGMSVEDHAPIDSDESVIDLEVLLGALLLAKDRNQDIELVLSKMAETYGEEVLLQLPGKAIEYAKKGKQADREFNRNRACESLFELAQDMKPLLSGYRKNWLARKNSPCKATEKTSTRLRVAQGKDSKQMELARQHWGRFQKALVKHKCLAPFLEHMMASVPRDRTHRGTFLYRPTANDLPPFWRTE